MVQKQPRSVGTGLGDANSRLREGRTESFLAFPQRLLGTFSLSNFLDDRPKLLRCFLKRPLGDHAFSDILACPTDTNLAPRFVGNRTPRPGSPLHCPVLRNQAVHDLVNRLPVEDLVPER